MSKDSIMVMPIGRFDDRFVRPTTLPANAPDAPRKPRAVSRFKPSMVARRLVYDIVNNDDQTPPNHEG